MIPLQSVQTRRPLPLPLRALGRLPGKKAAISQFPEYATAKGQLPHRPSVTQASKATIFFPFKMFTNLLLIP